MEHITSLFKALGDQNRLRTLAALAQHKKLCACEILSLLKISGATLSRHMGILVSTGLVRSEKRGKWVYYSLIPDTHPAQPVLRWLLTQFEASTQFETDTQLLQQIVNKYQSPTCSSAKLTPKLEHSKIEL